MPTWFEYCFCVISATGLTFYIMQRFLRKRTILCDCVSPNGRHAIITGATSGIGLLTALELAKRQWKLTLGCRNMDSAQKVLSEIKTRTNNPNVRTIQLDLDDPTSIRQFVKDCGSDSVHVLINNAGVFPNLPRANMAYKGIDLALSTNYVGHFYLTCLLLPLLQKTYDKSSIIPRVVIVSSSLSSKGSFSSAESLFTTQIDKNWNPTKSYANSKLACNLFARELHRRFGSGVNAFIGVYCLFTGGMINTNLNRYFLANYPYFVKECAKFLLSLLLKSPLVGCQSILHCAYSNNSINAHVSSKELPIKSDQNGSGLLYNNCTPISWPQNTENIDLARHLWDYTYTFLNLNDHQSVEIINQTFTSHEEK